MSSEGWKRVQLGDILTLHYGKALVAHKRNPGLIPVYSSSGITGWHNKPLINDKGIIIGRKGNVGSVFYSNTPFYCIDTAYYVTPNDTDLDFVFLYYLLQTLGLKDLNEDSAVPGLNRETALAQWVDVPVDKNLQSLIANQIAIFDDKIELNRQTNATLEAIAQAIFKEWFVDFNYPGATGEMVESELGPIPKGWRVVSIGDLFGSVIGGDWGSDKRKNEDDVLCAVIRGTDFEDFSKGFVDAVPHRFIKHKSFNKRCLREGDIILEISGGSRNQATGRNIRVSTDLLDLFDSPVVPTSFCRLIRPVNIDISVYLGFFLSGFYEAGGTWDYQLQSTGISNFQFVDFSTRLKIFLPDSQTLQSFRQTTCSLIDLQGTNSINNKSLIFSLKLLLPRLLCDS